VKRFVLARSLSVRDLHELPRIPVTMRSLMVPSAQMRARPGLPLLEKGFRPFFLLGASFATLVVPIWITALEVGYAPGGAFGAMQWHAHEMLFGFTTAIIAGFLLTAVGNWTNRETAVGTPLALLAVLWSLGRVAVFFAERAPRMAAFVDAAFLPALALTCAIPVVAAKNRRNYAFIGLLALLACLNGASHWAALQGDIASVRAIHVLALDVIVIVIVAITGRIIPMFTRNATRIDAIRGIPLLEKASLASVALLTISDALPGSRVRSGVLATLAAVLLFARMARWGTRHTLREPLLWILHAGVLWVPVGLALRAGAEFGIALPPSSALHALTAGAIGSLTLGMMARVSLGHTGRMLKTPRPMTVAFGGVILAGIVRVAAAFLPGSAYLPALEVATVLWSAAFLLFVVGHAKILVSPRADRRP
jgi:uncharacterized protein involved in response to NO